MDFENKEQNTHIDIYEKEDNSKQPYLWILLLIFFAGYILFSYLKTIDFSTVDWSKYNLMVSIFTGIIIQAFPFILIGVLVSSVIQVFISQKWIEEIFPKSLFLAMPLAVVAGVFFPVCDCAVVPVANRLIKKGISPVAAITFMLAAPIVNPVVVISTLYAFPNEPYIAVYRVCIGILTAVTAGIFLKNIKVDKISKDKEANLACECEHRHEQAQSNQWFTKINEILNHAGAEFFDVGKYIIMGAGISAIVQAFVPQSVMTTIGLGKITSLFIMMAAAFTLSVCSTSDAFIAKSFSNQFSKTSVMGFMIIGPMLDIKNLLMWSGVFRKRFIFRLIVTVVASAFCFLMLYIYLSKGA